MSPQGILGLVLTMIDYDNNRQITLNKAQKENCAITEISKRFSKFQKPKKYIFKNYTLTNTTIYKSKYFHKSKKYRRFCVNDFVSVAFIIYCDIRKAFSLLPTI